MASLNEDIARLVHNHNPLRAGSVWSKMTPAEREPYRTLATKVLDYLMTHGPEAEGKTPEGKIRVRGYFRPKAKKHVPSNFNIVDGMTAEEFQTLTQKEITNDVDSDPIWIAYYSKESENNGK